MTELIKILQQLMTLRFWGEILIKFEGGKIVHVRKTESIKIENK